MMEDGRLSIEAALERLHQELSGRNRDSMAISVSEPEEFPHVASLARLINQYGSEVAEFLSRETKRHQQRSDELMQAYNALQSQTEEMRKELDMARRIQLRLLPQDDELPNRPELACAGYYESMSNVGGDLYDIIRIGRNSYGVLIADVSGHGVPAALITALVKISFRTKIHWGVSTAEVCRLVNEELYPLLNDLDYYVTAYFLIIDLEAASLEYTNCGHHPALLLRVSEDEPVPLDTRGRFLGAFDDAVYVSEKLPLEPQDLILVYTDGIIESRNLMDEEYGYERLIECLLEIGIDDPDKQVALIRRNMEGFTMGASPRDDRSMFAVQFRSGTDETQAHDLARAESIDPDEPAAAPPAAGPGVPPADQTAVRLLNQEVRAVVARKEWRTAVSLIRVLDSLGQAKAGHLCTLSSIYFRAGRFREAIETAGRGLMLRDLNAHDREVLETIIRRSTAV